MNDDSGGAHLVPEPVAEPVAGWRYSQLRINKRGELVHAGVSFGSWSPNGHEAACAKNKPHDAPDFDCDCGYWMCHDRDTLARTTAGLNLKGNVVEGVGWGTVVEHELGWRCQYLRITRVHVGTLDCHCSRPGTHVRAFNGKLKAVCADHATDYRNDNPITLEELREQGIELVADGATTSTTAAGSRSDSRWVDLKVLGGSALVLITAGVLLAGVSSSVFRSREPARVVGDTVTRSGSFPVSQLVAAGVVVAVAAVLVRWLWKPVPNFRGVAVNLTALICFTVFTVAGMVSAFAADPGGSVTGARGAVQLWAEHHGHELYYDMDLNVHVFDNAELCPVEIDTIDNGWRFEHVCRNDN